MYGTISNHVTTTNVITKGGGRGKDGHGHGRPLLDACMVFKLPSDDECKLGPGFFVLLMVDYQLMATLTSIVFSFPMTKLRLARLSIPMLFLSSTTKKGR